MTLTQIGADGADVSQPGDGSAIEVKNLFYSYSGKENALENATFEIRRNDFLAVIGPNGGGKTTLIKIILGLLKPSSGIVRVLGKSPEKNSRKIGYVPQETSINMDFPISVFDVVKMGRLQPLKGLFSFSRDDSDHAAQALEFVGMKDFMKRRIGSLSGGQRQRVFIARALVSDPEILILDEPTASVDTQGQTELYERLAELNKEKTVIVVSHDLMVISGYVKSVACVNRSVYYHGHAELTPNMLEMAYNCPVDLVAHGFPHRVLKAHADMLNRGDEK